MPLVKDIAEKLHVSPSTVSMVLNNKPGISAATRKRVFEAMDELGYSGYTPRAVEKKRLDIQFILYKKHGKIVTDTPFFSNLMEGIESQSRKHNYHLSISYITEGSSIEEQLRSSVPAGCQGILLLATEMREKDLLPFRRLGIPMVVVDSYFETFHTDTVVINNVQGAFEATRHLIECGHRQIGYFYSKIPINNFLERRDGYRKALMQFGVPEDPDYEFPIDPNMDGAYNDVNEMLSARKKLPTAFFCDNDNICIGVLKALREHNIRIPEDISLVGFDDIPICEMMEPQITTVHVHKQDLGSLAVDRLSEVIENGSKIDIKIEVSTTLAIRGSVKNL